MYPSIIRANNLCYSTLVLADPGADPGECVTVETSLGTFKFVQGRRGVVPALLEDLAKFRKQAKKDMAAAEAAGDEWVASLFNAKQLAYKITMNSAYGFLGATKGMLPCVPIAASVTAIGRDMIKQTKHMAETLVPGSRVVYGDTGACCHVVVAVWLVWLVWLLVGLGRAGAGCHQEAGWVVESHCHACLLCASFVQTPSWSFSTWARTSGTTCAHTLRWRSAWPPRSARCSSRPTNWSLKRRTTRTSSSARSGTPVS